MELNVQKKKTIIRHCRSKQQRERIEIGQQNLRGSGRQSKQRMSTDQQHSLLMQRDHFQYMGIYNQGVDATTSKSYHQQLR